MDPCIVDYSVEIPTRCSFVREFTISEFIEGWTCFERHTTHHQELQTVFAASGLYAHMVTVRWQGWVGNANAFPTQPWQRPVTIWAYKPEAANKVWSSWWWVVCRSKHIQPSINFGIVNSITKLHLVGISTEYYTTSVKELSQLLNGPFIVLTADKIYVRRINALKWGERQRNDGIRR